MKALAQIILYLAATVLIGALLAPPLYWFAHAAAGHLHNARLTDFLAKTDFQRFFDRSMTIVALALLWPLLRALKIEDFGYDLGLRRDRRGWRRLAVGFALALVTLLFMGGILMYTGVYRLRSHFPYEKLAWLPVSAAAVAVIEEFLFRGALQGAVRKTTVDSFAMISVAVLYAAVHFLKPVGTEPAQIHWWSGLALLPQTLGQFRQPALLLGGFSTLLLAGLILGYARDRTRSLWMPVGLHAGWVVGKMGLMDVSRTSVAWPWVGPDILIGLAPLLTLLVVWAIVWLMLREAQ
ncbi:MAG: CPBP family intramembrane glutamic endopeptidase [Chthoniobacteraceae bacterium]